MLPSASWKQMGDSAFYRAEDIYTMQWSLPGHLSDYSLAVAPSGGPLALLRLPSSPSPLRLANSVWGSRPQIVLYNAAGSLLAVIPWDLPARPVRIGFTASESLVVVLNDGSYRLYPLSSPQTYSSHSLGNEAADTGVLDARIYDNGLVVLLGSLSALHLSGWPDHPSSSPLDSLSSSDNLHNSHFPSSSSTSTTNEKLPQLEIPSVPPAWNIIPPAHSSIRAIQVLLPHQNTILVVDPIDVQDQRFDKGPFTHVEPSPNGRFIALISASSELYVVSADFSRVLSQHNLSTILSSSTKDHDQDQDHDHDHDQNDPESSVNISQLRQVVWCGNDTIVLAIHDRLVMVGPFGEKLSYWYPEPVYITSEIDGTRVFTTETCEFLQKVPDPTNAVFRPGSAYPAAILYEASELLYERQNPKADEMIRSIKSDLESAVNTCIDAAGKEFDVARQRKLLKAASLGKNFLDIYDPAHFVNMSRSLRVLNAVRYYQIGIAITYDEFTQTSPEHLIKRLTLRSHHLLALRIATFLNLPTSPVLLHWAFDRVSKSSDSNDANVQELVKSVVDTLKDQPDVGCADVAKTAWDQGKRGLAAKLLEHETRLSKQVPLLLNMGQENAALSKAVESGNPDLVLEVLLHLRRNHSLGKFLLFIDNKPDATALLQVYAAVNDIELLRDFYYQDDRRTESACLALSESVSIAKASSTSSSSAELSERIAKLKTAQKSFNEDKERAFEAKLVDEQLRLLALQQSLENESDGRTSSRIIGMTVNDTIRHCILAGSPKKADKIKSDFRVPDKRFWYIKMKALCEIRDWEGLESFARSGRSPIGYEAFVNHLIKIDQQRQAASFVEKCDAKNRVELYVKCGEWIRAGKECQKRSERAKLIDLRQRCPNNIIAAQLEQLIEDMGTF